MKQEKNAITNSLTSLSVLSGDYQDWFLNDNLRAKSTSPPRELVSWHLTINHSLTHWQNDYFPVSEWSLLRSVCLATALISSSHRNCCSPLIIGALCFCGWAFTYLPASNIDLSSTSRDMAGRLVSINEMRFFDEFLTDGSSKKFYFQFQHVKNHLSATRKTHNVVQFFRTTVVVRREYILSLVLSNKYLENIMMKTLKDYNIFIPIS